MMKEPIRVSMDPRNPGQFLACCGLLELADRCSPGAEGYFGDGHFFLYTGVTLHEILASLVTCLPREMTRLDNGLAVKPLIAPLRLSLQTSPGEKRVEITLDAWMRVVVTKGEVTAVANEPWNFWSGQQTPLRIWRALRTALVQQMKDLEASSYESLFNQRVALPGRFGFDPGAAWNALDVGFSPNEQKLDVASSPAVELLASIGIQRFRPRIGDESENFHYATWGQPLSPVVAPAAACGAILFLPCMIFRGRVISRGSYAALGYSTRLERS